MHVFDVMGARLDFGQPARRVDRCLLQQLVRFGWRQRAHGVQGMAAVLKELSHERALEFRKGIADGALDAHDYLPPSIRSYCIHLAVPVTRTVSTSTPSRYR